MEVGGQCRCPFFYHVGSGDRTQITRLVSEHLYPKPNLLYLIYLRVPVVFNDGETVGFSTAASLPLLLPGWDSLLSAGPSCCCSQIIAIPRNELNREVAETSFSFHIKHERVLVLKSQGTAWFSLNPGWMPVRPPSDVGYAAFLLSSHLSAFSRWQVRSTMGMLGIRMWKVRPVSILFNSE